MNKAFISLAAVISGVAIVLAMDLGRLKFDYVDAGGPRLRMLIRGHQTPTVVFETGWGGGSSGAPLEMWGKVQSQAAKFTSTVAYDRAGTGLSSPGTEPYDGREFARELHTALRNARVAPPYILVGHSFGGPLIRIFAGLYPSEVCGMVLVDPTQEEFINRPPGHKPKDMAETNWRAIQAGLAEAHESRMPEGIPVVLITGMGPRVLPSFATEKEQQEYRDIHQLWLKFHTEWLAKVPQGQHIITEKSGHNVPVIEPELIVGAIRRMVEQVRRAQN